MAYGQNAPRCNLLTSFIISLTELLGENWFYIYIQELGARASYLY